MQLLKCRCHRFFPSRRRGGVTYVFGLAAAAINTSERPDCLTHFLARLVLPFGVSWFLSRHFQPRQGLSRYIVDRIAVAKALECGQDNQWSNKAQILT